MVKKSILLLLLIIPSYAYSQVIQSPCPAGTTSLQSLQTTNTTNGQILQNWCTSPNGSYILQNGGGGTGLNSIPGTPGLTAVPVQNGLLAEYRILPTENPCALVDYTGNGNNATGCVGTAPTIVAGTGGITGSGAGAISLPSSLNASQTVLLFIQQTGSENANGVLLGGTGTYSATNGTLISLSSVAQSADQTLFDGIPNTASRIFTGFIPYGGSANEMGTYPRAQIGTTSNVGIVFGPSGGNDTFYFWENNQVQPQNINFLSQHGMQGHQTLGNFQLGGIAAASCTAAYNSCNYLGATGQILYAVFYNRQLSQNEFAQDAQFIQTILRSRGVTIINGFVNPNSSAPLLIADGDSETSGISTQTGFFFWPQLLSLGTPNPLGSLAGATWTVGATARAGTLVSGTAGLQQGGFVATDTYYQTGAPTNDVIIWAGTNDGSVGLAGPALRQYCTDRRAAGWKCIVASMLSRTGSDTYKDALNTYLRQNWSNFADGFADIGSDPVLGADGAFSNATYFLADGIHLQQVGIHTHVLPIMQHAVNRLHGAHSFSEATTYTSAAPAASAITAIAESATWYLVTSTLNPIPGQTVTISGVTPAGYNGNCQVYSSTASNFNCWQTVTGLGPGTVFGTASVPLQKDQDVYIVLNFGAGNFSLESCIGWTGQNIYIRNINAAASTLVPANAETITGPGTTTVAANTTAILQSQLVSAAAAGCNWVRIQ